MSYFTGFLLAVPSDRKDAYARQAAAFWEVFRDHGALSCAENWGVDVPDGKVTSFPMAVKKAEDETVVFSWIEWADKAAADAGWAGAMQDKRFVDLDGAQMLFDGKRMMWGGFETVFRA